MKDALTLLKGDCLERMKEIQDSSVDMVLTDPPYGMAFQSNRSKSGPRHEKIKGDDEIDPRFIKEAYRILKNNGGAFFRSAIGGQVVIGGATLKIAALL